MWCPCFQCLHHHHLPIVSRPHKPVLDPHMIEFIVDIINVIIIGSIVLMGIWTSVFDL
jgi:hypothetical protein